MKENLDLLEIEIPNNLQEKAPELNQEKIFEKIQTNITAASFITRSLPKTVSLFLKGKILEKDMLDEFKRASDLIKKSQMELTQLKKHVKNLKR